MKTRELLYTNLSMGLSKEKRKKSNQMSNGFTSGDRFEFYKYKNISNEG